MVHSAPVAEIVQIGPYRVAELMAHGGAGRVFRCVHEDTGQSVAVKVPLGASIYEREALRREIALLSRLSQFEYTSVVRLIEAGADAGMPWYAMEYIQGVHLGSYHDTLWGRIEQLVDTAAGRSDFRTGRRWQGDADDVATVTKTLASPSWPPSPARDSTMPSRPPRSPDAREAAAGHLVEVLRIGACLADGLDLIHCEGVVHGDLTPRNVIIRGATGEPVLLDFGTSFLAFRAGVGRELMHVVGRLQGAAQREIPSLRRSTYAPRWGVGSCATAVGASGSSMLAARWRSPVLLERSSNSASTHSPRQPRGSCS